MSPLTPYITSQLWEGQLRILEDVWLCIEVYFSDGTDMKPAGRILGVAVSDRGVLDQSWPDCPEIKLDQVNLSIRVSHFI